MSAISSCTTDCRSLCEWTFSLKFLYFNRIFFVFLVSVTAAKVVEMSRKDSCTLSRLAYFGKVYLTRDVFSSEVGLFIQSHLKSHFNRKSTSSRFWSKSSRFHQIKSLPGLAVPAWESTHIGWCSAATSFLCQNLMSQPFWPTTSLTIIAIKWQVGWGLCY